MSIEIAADGRLPSAGGSGKAKRKKVLTAVMCMARYTTGITGDYSHMSRLLREHPRQRESLKVSQAVDSVPPRTSHEMLEISLLYNSSEPLDAQGIHLFDEWSIVLNAADEGEI